MNECAAVGDGLSESPRSPCVVREPFNQLSAALNPNNLASEWTIWCSRSFVLQDHPSFLPPVF